MKITATNVRNGAKKKRMNEMKNEKFAANVHDGAIMVDACLICDFFFFFLIKNQCSKIKRNSLYFAK